MIVPVCDSQENLALVFTLVAEMYLNKSVLLRICCCVQYAIGNKVWAS